MSFDAALLADAVLLDAVTTGTGTGIQVNGGKLAKVFFKGAGTVSAGAVQFEEATDKDYTGTWSPIGSPQTLTTNQEDVLVFQGPFKAVRARVTTNVTGGGTTTTRVVIV